MPLSKKDLKRYSRQILLQIVSKDGQEKLSNSEVVVIGLGALGGAIANNLVRAGVGKLRLVDRDVVELENLHRQVIYDESMLGEPKALAAAEFFQKVNPDINITPVVQDVNFSTIDKIIANSSIILDGTDNLETRFLINDLSVKKSIPWVYGGVVGTQGMTMNILHLPGKKTIGPCFRCLVPQIPAQGALPTCDTYGIINTIPMIIGSIQSTEAIKLILDHSAINDKLLFYDVWTHEFRALNIQKNHSCRCCVKHDFEFLNIKKRTVVTSLCSRDSVQIIPIKSAATPLQEFEKKLSKIGSLKKGKHTLELKIEGYTITLFLDGRVLIKGTSDETVAKSLYAKYIGN